MSKNITQKIRDLLTDEDLKTFESAVDNMVSERVQAKLSKMIELKEDELKSKYESIAEQYVNKVVAEKLTTEKANLVEGYDEKLALLETKVTTNLNSFLDTVIEKQISDTMLEKVAVNETLQPVVEGIRSVFTDNHLKLNSKAQATIDSLTSDVASAKGELSESIEQRMSIEGKLQQSAVYLLISEKTSGFKTSDRQKVLSMFKAKAFNEVNESIDDYIDTIKLANAPRKEKATTNNKVAEINEGTVADVTKKPVEQEKAPEPIVETTMVDEANAFLG